MVNPMKWALQIARTIRAERVRRTEELLRTEDQGFVTRSPEDRDNLMSGFDDDDLNNGF
jgi:hypothetical protein